MNNKIKRFFKSSSIYIVCMFIVRASALLTMPILTRLLSKTEYGVLSVANSVGAVVLTIVGLGSAEYIQLYYQKKESVERKRLFGTFFIILMLFPLILIIVPFTVFGSSITGFFINKEIPFYPYILIVLWTSWLLNLNIFPYEYLKIQNQAIKFSILTISSTFGNIALTLVLVIYFSYGALGPLISKFAISIIFGLYFLIYTLREIKLFFSVNNAIHFFSFNTPLLVAILAGSLLSRVDIFILQKFVSLSEVAIYAVAVSIAGLIPFFIKAVNIGWVPFFYENVFKSEEDSLKMFGFTIDYILIGVIFIITWIIVFRHEVIHLLASSKYSRAADVLFILIIGYFFYSMRSFASRGILLAKKTTVISIIAIAGTISNIGLNYYYIPKYGIYGAACSTTFCFIAMYVVTHVLSQKHYRIEFHYLRIFKLFSASTITILFSHTFQSLAGFDPTVMSSLDAILLKKNLLIESAKSLIVIILFPLILLKTNYFDGNEKRILRKLFFGKLLRLKNYG
jgi:O-antigen/teichoic acid export membrane protein